MSTLEKNLYKRVKIDSNQKPEAPVSNSAYRALSTINESNKSFRLYDIEVIKQDIINHFHIRQGEKLENPEFGTIIWDVLFEPLTENLKEAIVQNVTEIINYDPRVNADRVIVDSYENGIQIECVLTYLNYNISEQMRFKFDQDSGFLA
jgi:phage baseplate assembly protein W